MFPPGNIPPLILSIGPPFSPQTRSQRIYPYYINYIILHFHRQYKDNLRIFGWIIIEKRLRSKAKPRTDCTKTHLRSCALKLILPFFASMAPTIARDSTRHPRSGITGPSPSKHTIPHKKQKKAELSLMGAAYQIITQAGLLGCTDVTR